MDSGKVIKQINIDLGLICEPADVVKMITTADEKQQAEIIGKLAHIITIIQVISVCNYSMYLTLLKKISITTHRM